MSVDHGPIQVVLAIYDPKGTYCRHAGVVVTSLFANTKERVCVTVLHDATLTEDNRGRFLKTADAFGQQIRFVDVSVSMSQLPYDPDSLTGAFSRGTLFRLFIPEVLPAAKIIYLDCDIAVNMDIGDLWKIDIDQVSLAATKDATLIRRRNKLHHRIRSRVMRFDSENYFNAGVLLMNLDRIRKKYSLPTEAFRYFRRYRLCLDYPDQDLLNTLFSGDVLLIDGRFDRIADHHNIDNAILHLTGKYKPWEVHLCEPRDYFYWQTFMQSEWRDQTIDAMFDTYRNNPLVHAHTADCVKRLLNRWSRDLLTHNVFMRLGKDLGIWLNEIRHRILGGPDS